jgi:2-succinyl-5-enolpyruvyl-6-hydroxy-3-cyclohexene-1-carboxylate synthase
MKPEEEKTKELKPDLLITVGRSVISKNLKLFLRKHPPGEHWHVQPAGQVADTYKSLTKIIRTDPNTFIAQALNWKINQANLDYRAKWHGAEKKAGQVLNEFKEGLEFGEFSAVNKIIETLPETCNLHLANSMPVRLANFIGLKTINKNVRVVANRGTSGIDGSNGTAVGEAMVSEEPVILITGDLAFFYDRNAFWHSYDISKLKIVLLNNHAGGIFGMIDGPSGLPELNEFFETHNKLSAKNTAADFGFEYHHCSTIDNLQEKLTPFFETSKGHSLLEIETSNELNKTIFREFKNLVKGSFE